MTTSALAIPDHLDELTPEWLTSALAQRGMLAGAKVRGIGREILGEGAGFLGVVARLTLDYEGEAGDAPRSLIAKLPTPLEDNRLMGEILGAYWREIHFYEEMSAQMPVRVPRLYYADLTPDPMREKQEKILRFIDKLPGWLVATLLVPSLWFVKKRALQYVLLIEDLAPAKVCDQVAGLPPDICEQTLRAAARIHAAFWQKPELAEKFWFARLEMGAGMRHRMYRSERKAFAKRYEKLLDDGHRPTVEWLDRHGAVVGKLLHDEAPHTLLHCDMRFDNIFLDERSDDPVIFADWQLTGVGAAAYDVAYLLAGGLRTEESKDVELGLLRAYHETLVSEGVTNYPFESFQRDYQRGLFAVLMVVASTGPVDLGDGRGIRMMDLWVERTLARLRGVRPETLV